MIVVKFSAAWCGPCKMLKPIFEKISNNEEFKEKYKFIEVDIDSEDTIELLNSTPNELSIRYMIRNIPTIIVLDDKFDIIDRKVGFLTESELIDFLKKIK